MAEVKTRGKTPVYVLKANAVYREKNRQAINQKLKEAYHKNKDLPEVKALKKLNAHKTYEKKKYLDAIKNLESYKKIDSNETFQLPLDKNIEKLVDIVFNYENEPCIVMVANGIRKIYKPKIMD